MRNKQAVQNKQANQSRTQPVSSAALDAVLPQTQCGLCSYKGCWPYAEALAAGTDTIDRCTPGGVETLVALAELTGIDPAPYKAAMHHKTKPTTRVSIAEAQCIGCTKCIQACPVDAILGAGKYMHSVLTQRCTGCDLCIPVCPVDCITVVPVPLQPDLQQRKQNATQARVQYKAKQARLTRLKRHNVQRYMKNKYMDVAAADTASEQTDRKNALQARQTAIQQAVQRSQQKRQAQEQIMALRKRCGEILQRLSKAIPDPATELQYHTGFELLIAVILSAQATDVGVNKATAKLFAVANTPEQIVALGEAGLRNYIRTIGLYNSKAKHIIQTCVLLIERYNGQVPNQRVALESLPGVGRKTANVVLNTWFGQPTIAVDTHIFRLSHRLDLVPQEAKTPRAVEDALMHLISPGYMDDAHHLFILHARYVCTARKPRCTQCVLSNLCTFKPSN